MRYVLLLTLFLAACGSGGGSTPATTGDPADGDDDADDTPVCKTIYNVWHSTSDQEKHDFSSFENGVTVQYKYTGSAGLLCGNLGAGYTINAKIIPFNHPAVPEDYRTLLEMEWNVYYGADCTYWESNTPTRSTAFVKLDCDTLTMCRDVGPLGHCKTFH